MTDRSRRPVRTQSWIYTRFDGSTAPTIYGADEVMAGITDDLLYHGDLAAALRRLLRDGFDGSGSDHVQGLDEILRKIAERKSQLASSGEDLATRVAEVLREVLELEHAELATARTEDSTMREMQLALLPDDLVGKIQSLLDYEFLSSKARQLFSDLIEELRGNLVDRQLDQLSSELASASPEEQQHLRDGLSALNQLIERQASGEEVDQDFRDFMGEFGDLFPGEPASLDELIAQLGHRMAAASQMMSGMSPEQRSRFDQLSERLLADVDLAWQMTRLSENLRGAMPDLDWDQKIPGGEGDPLNILGDSAAIDELAALEAIERQLERSGSPDALREVDVERAGQLLGSEVANSLRALADLTKRLEEAGLVGRSEGKLRLTPGGIRRLGSNALQELFARLRRDRVGNHQISSVGIGHDRAFETRPYEFGDPFRLDLQKTLRNALLRHAGEGERPARFPVNLRVDDFEVEQSEQLTVSSTVLAIDLSLSMPMEDNFLAAKKVAIALQSLISSRYPRDYLGLIGFSATAREIKPEDLPGVSWDFAYGTNLQHALLLARGMLSSQSGSKQIIVITDGEPTAHVDDSGEVFFQYPAVPETLQRTMLEVSRCTKDRIVINTFVLGATGGLRSFVDRMTRMNRGRAFFTTPDTLGDYLLVDFVSHHSSRSGKHLRRGA